jgi:hypothetical protein
VLPRDLDEKKKAELDRVKLLVTELLIGFHNNDTGLCDPGLPALARALGWTQRSTERVLAIAKQWGWIAVQQRPNHNALIGFPSLLDPPPYGGGSKEH